MPTAMKAKKATAPAAAASAMNKTAAEAAAPAAAAPAMKTKKAMKDIFVFDSKVTFKVCLGRFDKIPICPRSGQGHLVNSYMCC